MKLPIWMDLFLLFESKFLFIWSEMQYKRLETTEYKHPFGDIVIQGLPPLKKFLSLYSEWVTSPLGCHPKKLVSKYTLSPIWSWLFDIRSYQKPKSDPNFYISELAKSQKTGMQFIYCGYSKLGLVDARNNVIGWPLSEKTF